MRRKLTATTVAVLALVATGCGKDSSTATTAQSATTPAATTATTPGTKTKTTATKTTASKTTGSKKTTTGTKTSATKTATTAPKTTTTKKTTTATKTTTTKKKTPSVPTGVTPQKATTTPAGDPSSGTGSGPTADRLAVVATLRRYYKGFIDGNGAEVCSLLTDAGKAVMIADGTGKTCADSVKRLIAQAGTANQNLLVTTREGIHVNDITVTGNNATAQIGKTSKLKLVQENGKWLLRSPNVDST